MFALIVLSFTYMKALELGLCMKQVAHEHFKFGSYKLDSSSIHLINEPSLNTNFDTNIKQATLQIISAQLGLSS